MPWWSRWVNINEGDLKLIGSLPDVKVLQKRQGTTEKRAKISKHFIDTWLSMAKPEKPELNIQVPPGAIYPISLVFLNESGLNWNTESDIYKCEDKNNVVQQLGKVCIRSLDDKKMQVDCLLHVSDHAKAGTHNLQLQLKNDEDMPES